MKGKGELVVATELTLVKSSGKCWRNIRQSIQFDLGYFFWLARSKVSSESHTPERGRRVDRETKTAEVLEHESFEK